MEERVQSSMDAQFVIAPTLAMVVNSASSRFVDLVSVSMEVGALSKVVNPSVIVGIRAMWDNTANKVSAVQTTV